MLASLNNLWIHFLDWSPNGGPFLKSGYVSEHEFESSTGWYNQFICFHHFQSSSFQLPLNPASQQAECSLQNRITYNYHFFWLITLGIAVFLILAYYQNTGLFLFSWSGWNQCWYYQGIQLTLLSLLGMIFLLFMANPSVTNDELTFHDKAWSKHSVTSDRQNLWLSRLCPNVGTCKGQLNDICVRNLWWEKKV